MFYSTGNSVVLITTGSNKDNKNLMNIKPSCQTFSITFILTSLAKWNTSLGLRQWKNAHAHAHAVPPSERTEWLRMCRTKNVQVYNVCKNTNKPTVIILMHQFKQRLEERMNYQAFNTVERLLKSTTHKQKLACSHSFHWYVNNVYKHNILLSPTRHVATSPELKFFQVPMASAYKRFNYDVSPIF